MFPGILGSVPHHSRCAICAACMEGRLDIDIEAALVRKVWAGLAKHAVSTKDP